LWFISRREWALSTSPNPNKDTLLCIFVWFWQPESSLTR